MGLRLPKLVLQLNCNEVLEGSYHNMQFVT